MTKLVLSFAIAAGLLRADFDARNWQTRIAIQVESKRAVSAFVVTPEIYRNSKAELRDVRIINDGKEVSYWIESLSGSQQTIDLQPKLLDKAVTPGVGLHAVLDLGDLSHGSPQRHNRLTIVTLQQNFRESVRIETSDDRRAWDMVRADAVIVDVTRADRQVSDFTVEYPESTRRYVRLTVPGWSEPSYLQSAMLTYSKPIPGIRDRLATAAPAVEQDEKGQRTLATIDAGFAGLPFDELELTVRPGIFSRRVEVLTGNDGKEWTYAGQKVISRNGSDQDLSIRIPTSWNRYARLGVSNGDSPPIEIGKVTMIADRRLVHFSSATAGAYWLYLGNANARSPSYDITSIRSVDDSDRERDASASLGRYEANSEYRAPTSGGGGHSQLLTLLLVAAVVGMGLVTVQMMKRVKAS